MTKNNITFAEMKNCIDMAVELCFENSEYQPYMKDFAVWQSIIRCFTDYITEEMTVEEIYSLTLDTKLLNGLESNHQVATIRNAIDDAIKVRIEKELHKSPLLDLLPVIIDILDSPDVTTKANGYTREIGMVEKDESENSI